MALKLEAACGCSRGKIRRKNEDNFYFDSQYLVPGSDGLACPLVMEASLPGDQCFALFDGMGGENFGELASLAAAERLCGLIRENGCFPASAMAVVTELNAAVVAKARELCTEHMGTTMASLFFHENRAYVCNLGDSRGYLLRGGGLRQLTEDHMERINENRPGRKRPLTQYLGIPPEELSLEPCTAAIELMRGDRFLLCSDGLTDMVDDADISRLLSASASAESAADDLIRAALDNGGRDNITVIVCRIL